MRSSWLGVLKVLIKLPEDFLLEDLLLDFTKVSIKPPGFLEVQVGLP